METPADECVSKISPSQGFEQLRGPLTVPPVKPARWTLRRTLSFGLIVSGVIWLAIGLAIRFFIS